MYFQAVWNTFHDLIRVEDRTVISDNKISACNQGYLALLELMTMYSQLPEDLKTVGYGIDIAKGVNNITLPSDFYALSSIYCKNTDLTTYNKILDGAIISYDKLQKIVNSGIYDTNVTGTPSLFAQLGSKSLYFDVYNIYYDELQFDSVSGSFATDTSITSGDNTATVTAWDNDNLKMTISSISGEFSVGDTITGDTSGNTGEITGIVMNDGLKVDYFKIPTTLTNTSLDTQLIELGNSYHNILALAFAVQWLFFEDSPELEAKQKSLIDMVKSRNYSLKRKASYYNSLNI